MEWSVTLERCMTIARRVLGDAAPEPDVAAFAGRIRSFALAAPPLTTDQADRLTAILRP